MILIVSFLLFYFLLLFTSYILELLFTLIFLFRTAFYFFYFFFFRITFTFSFPLPMSYS